MSAKIALKAFSFALAFPAKLLSATQTSPSRTGEEHPARRVDAGILIFEAEAEVEPELVPERKPEATPEPEADRRFERDLASVSEEDTPEPEEEESELAATRNGAEPESVPEAESVPEPTPAAVERASSASPPASVDSPMEIRFAKMSEDATLPTRANEGDAGMDLCAAESARIGPGQRVGVGTGLAVEIPEGWAGMVLPRSGLALKHGIALVNSPGLIDPGYRGEVRVLLLNTDATAEFKVAVGDRIAQLVLTPFSTAKPIEAEGLETSARGEGGFGSSGV
ncbi:MAG: dUTP diphosphatase [Solirubrobacterales bacterium]